MFGATYYRALAQRAGFDDALLAESDGTINEIAQATSLSSLRTALLSGRKPRL
ncbi:hypothetical protein ACWDSJ_06885 [Nocardia sp. NPDC003482]